VRCRPPDTSASTHGETNSYLTNLSPRQRPNQSFFGLQSRARIDLERVWFFSIMGVPSPIPARPRGKARYDGGIFMHIATTGLLAGTGLRQLAERSVGMTAALRRAPQ
jgi:hypothetical protein